MPIPRDTPVIFDINVYIDFLLGDGDQWPLIPAVPPSTGNPAADAIGLAFDGKFHLFASPHILRNVRRITMAAGQPENVADEYVAAIIDICEFSGGAIVQPDERDHGVADFEDNLIVSLAKDDAVDALIIVTRDSDLLSLGPSLHGRLLMHTAEFARRAL